MSPLEEIRANRLKKLEILEKKGIEPYPISSNRDYTLAAAIEKFAKISRSNKTISLVGRIMSLRLQGALAFLDLYDGTARFQALIKRDELKAGDFEFFLETVYIGDFIEVKGILFSTKRGEKTIQAKGWRMLSKSLRSLPEKWHGLQDVEERFRRRYLDTLMSEKVRNCFITRSRIITYLRKFLDDNEYLEVETPALQPLAGGTNAAPFVTHHNALDVDLFLRIAPELYLKKLLVGGFPKVYELGRNFRNEGIDLTHNPEFTMLEFYEAFSTALKQRVFVENLMRSLVKDIFGSYVIESQKDLIDFSKNFIIITYAKLLEKHAHIDPRKATRQNVKARAQELGIRVADADSREKIIDNIYKKTVRPKLIQPTFVTEYPTNMLPLAKKSEKDPNSVDVFQLIAGGMEIVKAFSELNNPLDQRMRFAKEEENAKAGDKEAQPNDEEFIEALEYGMPPSGGVGIGIDRLTMLLTNTRNIKEVILFPTMRPKS